MTFEWLPHYVRTNDIDLATYHLGSGPSVVMLHGFPELAYSWRHQIEVLGRHGWHAIAPDLRGFGATGSHGDVLSYSFANLAKDVFGMIAALGLRRPVLIGHDFGGALAWSIARDHPKAISGIISLNTPYTRRGHQDLVSTMREYRGETNYMVSFQAVGVAEGEMERDISALFRNLMRRPALKLSEFQADSRLKALPMTLFTGEPAVMGEAVLSETELEVYIEAFGKTGFEGALNWYRNLPRNWHDAADKEERVDVPALMVSASDDFFLPPETTLGMEQIVPDLERALIRSCGHWTQQEQPEAVNRIIIDWLERRMRPLFS